MKLREVSLYGFRIRFLQGIAHGGELYLDRKLADKRVFPALEIARSGTRKEELLLSPEELDKVWVLRKALQPLGVTGAVEFLLEKMRGTKRNKEFLELMKVQDAPVR